MSLFSVDGLMTVTNVTLAFFNNVCGRQDFALQVGQHNDDGQFPITTNTIFVYNTSQTNLICNGWPNLDVVNPARCEGELFFLSRDKYVHFFSSLSDARYGL
jgi:hypothetical protein